MNVLAIAGRELRAIFNTTIGWMVLAGFLLVTGVFWSYGLSWYVTTSQDMLANPYGQANMNLTDYLLKPFFSNVSIVLLMLAPALSMRVFAEEFKQRTMELLFTSPVSTLEIVLGKFLGVLGFIAVMLLCTAHYPLSLWLTGSPDPGAIAAGYASLLLLSAGVLSMGLLFSAWTSNQIVAAVLTFALALALAILNGVNDDPDSITYKLSILGHLDDLQAGAIQLSDLVYFAAFVTFFLFATHQRVESYRWR